MTSGLPWACMLPEGSIKEQMKCRVEPRSGTFLEGAFKVGHSRHSAPRDAFSALMLDCFYVVRP